MLALLLLLHNVAAKETQNDVLITQHITSCPDTGYYFKRDVIPNAIDPGPCNLCFCQDNTTSVCWLRESKRCDPKGYTFRDGKKRADRSRRSPGFSDIFFRDAAREVFNRQAPQECKPFESSISEGCPPADWCIGCTVCDCDANGRWDCHTLSFCPDKKGKKQVRKKKYDQRNRIVKRQLPKKKTTHKTTKIPSKKPTNKSNKKTIVRKKPQNKNNKSKQNKKQVNKNKVNKKGNNKKVAAVKKSKGLIHKKMVPPKIIRSNQTVKKGKKPITINSNKVQRKKGKPLEQHEVFLYTKNILKKMMASVDKIVTDSKNKVRRSMTKQISNKNKKGQSNTVKKIRTWQPMKNVKSNRKHRSSRRKRQISKDSGDQFEKSKNVSNFHPKIENIVFSPSRKYINETVKNELSISSNKNKYFEYNVDSKYDNNTKEKNKSEEHYTKTQILLKSNDLKSVCENNVTVTESTIFYHGYNGSTTTRILIDLSDIAKNSLFKMSLNSTSYKKNKTCGKFCKLIKKIKILIGDVSRTVTKKKDNEKTKNLMPYLKNVFRRLFQANKKKTASVTKKPVYRKRNIIKKICMNIKPCNFDPLDKTVQSKLDQLRKESNIILKAVRTIKGLLKLLDGKEFIFKNNISSIGNNQKNEDIFILNAILKDGHNLASTFTNLTETQLKQIDYIRDNTTMFIQSIQNFALILDDIMKLLRKDNKQRISRRTLRCTRKYRHESVKNSIVAEKIQKLKNLLIKYNLVQNKFMKGMFDVLVTLEQKTKPDMRKLAKVSDEIAKYNESRVIDNYTKKIINNLRKLKNLAEKLSFKNRMKRRAMEDDDAIGYFLLLIEFLLKQKRPLDVPPVSDGIDILIDAIQNSPDLKSNQKIDLDSVPMEIIKTDIINSKSSMALPNHSKNKINENNIILKAKKVIKVFESLDEEPKTTNMYDYTDKYDEKIESENEKKLFNKKSENDKKFFNGKSFVNDLDLTTVISNVYIAKDDDEKVNSILGRFDSEKMEKKGFEVFVDDTEEDDVIIVTSTQSPEVNIEIDMPVIQNTPKRTTFPLDANKGIEKNALNTLKTIKKTNLEWIDENSSHEENRRDVVENRRDVVENRRDVIETTTQTIIQIATRTLKTSANRYLNPVSSMSREVEDEKKGKTMNPEHLMHKKQMNLLNSLDYETEKSVLDSDSKEEKYNSDFIPFV